MGGCTHLISNSVEELGKRFLHNMFPLSVSGKPTALTVNLHAKNVNSTQLAIINIVRYRNWPLTC